MRLWLCAQTISFALLFMEMHAQPCDWGVHLFQVGLAWIPVYRFGIFACNSAQIFLCVRYYLIMQSMARLAKTKWPNRRQSNSFARCRRVNVNLRWRVWTVAPQRRQTYVLFALQRYSLHPFALSAARCDGTVRLFIHGEQKVWRLCSMFITEKD